MNIPVPAISDRSMATRKQKITKNISLNYRLPHVLVGFLLSLPSPNSKFLQKSANSPRARGIMALLQGPKAIPPRPADLHHGVAGHRGVGGHGADDDGHFQWPSTAVGEP